MLIFIKDYLVNDIFGQYKGIYLSDKELLCYISNESTGNQTLRLNKNGECTLDFMMQRATLPSKGEIIEVNNYVLMSYAKNIDKGIIIIITGKHNVITPP